MCIVPNGGESKADDICNLGFVVGQVGCLFMNVRYFVYCDGLTMTSQKFHDLFGGPPREGEDRLGQREMDLAASVQRVCEEVMLALARHAKDVTGADYLCMAGGCALNCVANGIISRERI